MYKLVVYSDGPPSGDLLEMFYDDLVSVTSGTRKHPDGTPYETDEEFDHYSDFLFIGNTWRNTDAHAQAVKRGYLAHVESVA